MSTLSISMNVAQARRFLRAAALLRGRVTHCYRSTGIRSGLSGSRAAACRAVLDALRGLPATHVVSDETARIVCELVSGQAEVST